MHTFEQKITINRPVQDVFDYITDPLKSPEWQSAVEKVAWVTEGPPGVGSSWKTTGKFMGREIDSALEITSWDPPAQTSFKTVTGPVPFELTATLAEEGAGTNLTMRGTAEFGGFFKLAEGLVGKQMDKQMGSDLKSLKEVLEKGTT